MSSLEDHTFELYSISFFSSDSPFSHQNVLLTQIVTHEEYLKTLASLPREINPGQHRRIYAVNYLFKNDKEQTNNDGAGQSAAGHQKQMKHSGEPKSRSSPKRRRTATVTHDVHEEKTENNQTPPNGFLPKSAAPELMNMAADDLPPKQFDSVSDDFTSLSKDDLTDKPGSNTVERGTQTCSVSVGDSKATVMSSTGTVPNTLQISPAMAQKINDDIKYQLMKEVRRFGRKYERIFTLLEGVQGPLEVKKQFVEFTIKEARRFKRGVLIQQLEKFLEKVESDRLGNGVNHKKNR